MLIKKRVNRQTGKAGSGGEAIRAREQGFSATSEKGYLSVRKGTLHSRGAIIMQIMVWRVRPDDFRNFSVNEDDFEIRIEVNVFGSQRH